MRPNWNSGRVSDWGISNRPVTFGSGGAIDPNRTFNKSGLPNVGLIWQQVTTTFSQNFQYVCPFVVSTEITVDAYLSRPNAGSASSVLKAYIYRFRNDSLRDGTVADFVTGTDATIDITSAANVTTLLSSAVTLGPAIYGLLFHFTSAASPQMYTAQIPFDWWNGGNVQSGTGLGVPRQGLVITNTASAPGSTITMANAGASATGQPIQLRYT